MSCPGTGPSGCPPVASQSTFQIVKLLPMPRALVIQGGLSFFLIGQTKAFLLGSALLSSPHLPLHYAPKLGHQAAARSPHHVFIAQDIPSHPEISTGSRRRCRRLYSQGKHSTMLEKSSSGSTIAWVGASHMKKAIAGIAVGLAILGSGFLAPLSETDVAMAAMAPSLMQDEKGYISIFEKVRALGFPIRLVSW